LAAVDKSFHPRESTLAAGLLAKIKGDHRNRHDERQPGSLIPNAIAKQNEVLTNGAFAPALCIPAITPPGNEARPNSLASS
jgi:hypothetical protein